MWRITKISNAKHEVTIEHKDGTEHAFVIPEEHRDSRDTKSDFIASKIKEQDAIKKAADAKEIKALERKIHRINPLWYIIAIQTLAMLGFLYTRFK